MLAALLFGALLSGTSQRNLDPTIFEPELASNLTLIIQGFIKNRASVFMPEPTTNQS